MLGAAKDQLSILTTLFAGGYFALISISDINDVKDVLKDQPILLKVGAILFIALPMFCWLISLIYANLLYLESLEKAKLSNWPNNEQLTYRDIMHHYLSRSQVFMVLGLVLLLLLLMTYLYVPNETPPSTPLQVQMITLNS